MRYVNVGLISLIFIVIGCDWAKSQEKIYTTDKEVELIGVVKKGVGYDANDRREEYYYLRLEKPISVAADEFGSEEGGVKDIQLVPLSGVVIGSMLSKHIAIKGKLFHAHTSHHHTKILLTITKPNKSHRQ